MEEKDFLEVKGRQRARLSEMFLIHISTSSHPWAGAALVPAGLSPDSAQWGFSTCIFLISQDADSLGLHVVSKAAGLSAEPGPKQPPFIRPKGPTRADVDVSCFFLLGSFLASFSLLQLVSACCCVLRDLAVGQGRSRGAGGSYRTPGTAGFLPVSLPPCSSHHCTRQL